MSERDSVIKKQRSRSLSETIAVYQKLIKFYFYNFFLGKSGYLLAFFYLVSATAPLFFFLLPSRVRSKSLSTFEALSKLQQLIKEEETINNENTEEGTETNFLHLSRLESIFREKSTIGDEIKEMDKFSPLETISFLIISLPNEVVWFLNILVFSFMLANTINGRIFSFLKRAVKSETSLQEEVIISSVSNIRTYDVFLFEVISSFLLQFLHLALTLLSVFFLPIPWKPRFSHLFWTNFLFYLRFLSSADPVTRIFTFFWQTLELYKLSPLIEKLPPNLCKYLWYFPLVRGGFLLFCLSQVLRNNFLKIKQLRK